MLRLMALDSEDLEVIAAHCQDAVTRIRDMIYIPGEKRFAMVLNRFDWENAQNDTKKRTKSYRRRQAGLRFECVKHAKVLNLDLANKSNVVKLLTISFAASEPPAGAISLIFSGGGEIRLEVECVECALKDLGAVWETPSKPDHEQE